jgi:hypothetical protein
MRRPSQPFLGHNPSGSTSSLSHELRAPSAYAPSVYAQSTLAASTIMPGMAVHQVRNTETVRWQEGHCLQWRNYEEKASCSVCEEKSDEGIYRCNGTCRGEPAFKHYTNSMQVAVRTPTANASSKSVWCVLPPSAPTKYELHSCGVLPAFYTHIGDTWPLPPATRRNLV